VVICNTNMWRRRLSQHPPTLEPTMSSTVLTFLFLLLNGLQLDFSLVSPSKAAANNKVLPSPHSHLSKRIIVTEVGSPFTQVQPGDNFLIIGANWEFNGYQDLDLTLDGAQFLTFKDLHFDNGVFEISVFIPVATTPGIHEWCASTLSRRACFDFLVCAGCGPTLGFVNGFNISSSTTDIFPYSLLSLVGDAFKPQETLTIYLDRLGGNVGTVLAAGIITQPNGRFQVLLPLPSNITYGSHTVSALGADLPFGEYPDYKTASFNIIQFMPDKS